MSKKNKIEKAIDVLEGEIAVRQFAIARLREQQATKVPKRKQPKVMEQAVNQ